nr:unnamed protein product [Callosobruchus chinensis]
MVKEKRRIQEQKGCLALCQFDWKYVMFSDESRGSLNTNLCLTNGMISPFQNRGGGVINAVKATTLHPTILNRNPAANRHPIVPCEVAPAIASLDSNDQSSRPAWAYNSLLSTTSVGVVGVTGQLTNDIYFCQESRELREEDNISKQNWTEVECLSNSALSRSLRSMLEYDKVVEANHLSRLDKSFTLTIPNIEMWKRGEIQFPEEALVCYTDGSRLASGQASGAGMYVENRGVRESYSLGTNTTIFEAEVYAILSAACNEEASGDQWVDSVSFAIVKKPGANEAHHSEKRFWMLLRNLNLTLRYAFDFKFDDSRAFSQNLWTFPSYVLAMIFTDV